MARSRLTDEQAAAIKGMVKRGDRQHDVAVLFGVNQARVNEIVHRKGYGKHYLHVSPAPEEQLPRPGPYVVVAQSYLSDTEKRALVYEEVVSALSELLERYRSKPLIS